VTHTDHKQRKYCLGISTRTARHKEH